MIYITKIIEGSRVGTKAIVAVIDPTTLDTLPLSATDNGDGTAKLQVDTEFTATIDSTGLATVAKQDALIAKFPDQVGGSVPVTGPLTNAELTAQGLALASKQDTGNASMGSMDGHFTDARSIDHNQVTMTGSAVQLSATSKVYKRLILSPHPDNSADMFSGKTGVTISTGEFVSALMPIEYINIDISIVYVIGTASDKVCWRGEY